VRIVGGKFSGRSLATPSNDAIRPTTDRTRESLFNILTSRAPDFFKNLRVLDLFAGTGALGLEALSRGASSSVHVENSIEGRALIQKNIEAFGLQGVARILRRDATQLGVIGTMRPFNLVFADPPYHKRLGELAFIAAYRGGWLAEDALLVLEEAKDVAINLPEQFTLEDQRLYGGTTIHIYKLHQSKK